MTKKLEDKAIDIKGKKYVLVSDRVLYFNENYPNGSIVTQRIIAEEPGIEIFKATITPDCSKPERYFTGYSQAKWGDGFINKTSALENAETSAIGRGLAMMGIGVIDSIASLDEINKAENTTKATKKVEKSEEKTVDDNPNGRFQRAIANKDFMRNCLDEEDYISKIKGKYTVDEVIERQLREAYKNATGKNDEEVDLLF